MGWSGDPPLDDIAHMPGLLTSRMRTLLTPVTVLSRSLRSIQYPAVGLAGSTLAPAREELLTQQGGALVLGSAPERRVLFRHADRGILGTVDVDALLRAALAQPQALARPGGP
jgi:hypothetical protein